MTERIARSTSDNRNHQPMTDDSRIHDSIEESTTTPANDAAPTDGEDSSVGGSGGGLLATAAGALLGVAGLGVLTDEASASGSGSGSGDRLLVLGDGRGKHDYEITMRAGGTIQKETHASGNDSVTTTSGGKQTVEGRVWHWNADNYTYTGKIESVRGEEGTSFHFLDGAFEDDLLVEVDGEDSGRHRYEIDTDSGDIDLHSLSTEGPDSDDGDADSEDYYTPDTVSGAISNYNRDKVWTMNHLINHVLIAEGEVSVSR